ncbi:sulfotransferase 1C4-like [Penaeus japonicus]|uniref:sulfotransferase 1C4-like n=1 Tax=Penaeus japonicus TaxID=27405 RepID=UPI001C7158C6|nr:sulfotransferase 1C4-like [Penaeus japonicus]
MDSEFPYALTPLPEEAQTKLKAKFLGFSGGLVGVEGRHIMPAHYARFAKQYFNYEFQDDDVLVMTFPRSGTTWTQEIVWTMRNQVDVDTASKVPLDARVPFIEFDSLHPEQLPLSVPIEEAFRKRRPGEDPREKGVFLDLVNALPSPRTIKTHLPFSLFKPDLLDKCKVVYVARNPKDVCVSYYHQQRLVKVAEFLGDFPEYVDFWTQDLLLQAPYWPHLAEGWARRHHPNVLFLFYEDMKENILGELGRLNTFLGTGLTESQLQTVAQHTSFSGMKSRGATNPTAALQEAGEFKKGEAGFIRKGTTGDWTNFFTPELEEKFQKWMEKWQPTSKEIPFKYHIKKPE